MRALRILLTSPAPPGIHTGNTTTAERWAAIFERLGHTATIARTWSGEPFDLLVALHAKKSFDAITRWRSARPDAPLVVALTGTDLYGDVRHDADAQRALALADRLVILQERGRAELPEGVRAKARTIVQSSTPSAPIEVAPGAFQVAVLAHLRAIKDPLRAAHAAELLPATSKIVIVHAGGALDDGLEAEARAAMAACTRYRWLGQVPRDEALGILAGSRLLVLTSIEEGGANVVTEAIAAGVPVVSSRIEGSLGLLGADHAGYFDVGDTAGLAALLTRCEEDAGFLAALRDRSVALAPIVDPAREREAWKNLLEELLPGRYRRGVLSPPSAAPATYTTPLDTHVSARLDVTRLAVPEAEATFVEDVRRGLTRAPIKQLACQYFYDELGSKLFEEICTLEEYYPPRAEREILEAHAAELAGPRAALVELGSGSATKTRIVIEAMLARHGSLVYVPIDVSHTMLIESSEALVADHPGLHVLGIAAEYQAGLEELARRDLGPKLVLWLGSNIGNFDRPSAAAFLRRVASTMTREDRLLVGADLRKDKRTLEAAYDDARGVTAAFNKNVLVRINRELGGHFDLDAFRHRAVYLEDEGKIEMHLVSTRAQVVHIDALDLDVAFAEGEHIHTEDSYKYSRDELATLADRAGLEILAEWTDQAGRFSETLFARR